MQSPRVTLASAVLVVASVLGVAGALPAVAATRTVAGVAVHDARAVLFPAGTEATVNNSEGREIACPADGECVTVGFLLDASTPANEQLFVAVQRGGVWGDGQVVAFPAGTYLQGSIGGASLSCASVGECDIAGNRMSAASGSIAFHVRITGGVAQTAEWLTVTGVSQRSPEETYVSDISCPTAGTCTIIGNTIDASPKPRAVEWAVTNGVAAPGTLIPLGTLVDAGAPESSSGSVTCVAAGTCVEVGQSMSATGWVGWVRTQSGGTWAAAQEITFAAGVLGTRAPSPGAIRCWAAGECMVSGIASSAARSDHDTPFVMAITGGAVQSAQFITVDPTVASSTNANSAGLWCATGGNCFLAFTVRADSKGVPEFATATAGRWGAAAAIPGLPAADDNYLEGADCVRAGECIAVGNSTDGSTHATFIVVMTGGVWQAPVTMTAASPLVATDTGGVHDLRCVADGTNCVSVGYWMRLLVANSVQPQGVAPSDGGSHAITQLSEFPPAPPAPAPEPEPATPKYTG